MARLVAAPVRVTLSPSRQAAGAAPARGNDTWARRTADAVMAAHPGTLTDSWHYDTGLVLYGIQNVARRTGDRRYADYVKATIDKLIDADGTTVKGYAPAESTLDDINMGKVLFALYAAARRRSTASRSARRWWFAGISASTSATAIAYQPTPRPQNCGDVPVFGLAQRSVLRSSQPW